MLQAMTTRPLWQHAAAAIGTIGYFQWIQGTLNASYAASGHPVDYATGQTSFDGPTIKGYYATMADQDTLNIYTQTQLIDFGFILAMVLIGLCVTTLIARLGRMGSWGRRIGIWAGISIIAGAICDAIENGWSFIMLANPTGFADWIALPYSTFAVIKFGLIAFGMLLILISFITSILGRVLDKPALG